MRSCASRSRPLSARLAGLEWRLIEDGTAPGNWNMAVDEALLEAARRDEAPPTFRLYAWSRPTLSLGRHQDPVDAIDHEYRRAHGIDLVRRPTGGRAVLHDCEVTYSIVLPAGLARGAGVGEVYCTLSAALLGGLQEELGVQVFRVPAQRVDSGVQDDSTRTPEHLNTASCFASAAGGDGVVEGGKLVGSAQARRAGAALQHGSVLLDVCPADWLGLFGELGQELPLSRLLGAAPEEAMVRSALRRGLEQALGAVWAPGRLTGAEEMEAERLSAERYGDGCLD
jgi:lipoate-protein ligase A